MEVHRRDVGLGEQPGTIVLTWTLEPPGRGPSEQPERPDRTTDDDWDQYGLDPETRQKLEGLLDHPDEPKRNLEPVTRLTATIARVGDVPVVVGYQVENPRGVPAEARTLPTEAEVLDELRRAGPEAGEYLQLVMGDAVYEGDEPLQISRQGRSRTLLTREERLLRRTPQELEQEWRQRAKQAREPRSYTDEEFEEELKEKKEQRTRQGEQRAWILGVRAERAMKAYQTSVRHRPRAKHPEMIDRARDLLEQGQPPTEVAKALMNAGVSESTSWRYIRRART